MSWPDVKLEPMAGMPSRAEALFDWSTGLTGLHVGRTWDLAGLYIARKQRLRAKEEQKRVLYVAMTRAREHLIISSAPTGRQSNGSFLSMLDETLQENIATAAESKTIAVGSGSVELRLVPENLVAPGRAKSQNPTKSRQKARIGNPTLTRGLAGGAPTKQRSRHRSSSRRRC